MNYIIYVLYRTYYRSILYKWQCIRKDKKIIENYKKQVELEKELYTSPVESYNKFLDFLFSGMN